MQQLLQQFIVLDSTKQYSAIISIDGNNNAYVRYQHNFDMNIMEDDIHMPIINELYNKTKELAKEKTFNLVAY